MALRLYAGSACIEGRAASASAIARSTSDAAPSETSQITSLVNLSVTARRLFVTSTSSPTNIGHTGLMLPATGGSVARGPSAGESAGAPPPCAFAIGARSRAACLFCAARLDEASQAGAGRADGRLSMKRWMLLREKSENTVAGGKRMIAGSAVQMLPATIAYDGISAHFTASCVRL